MKVDTKIKILIVDDNKVMRRIIKFHLSNLGFENLFEAKNGHEALKMLEFGGFSLILSDWDMEEMDGLAFLRIVKMRATLKNIPFIMITANNTRGDVVAAAEAGVNNYIVKPFSGDALKTKIEKVMGIIGDSA